MTASESDFNVNAILPEVIKFCCLDFKTARKRVKTSFSTAKCKQCGATICDKPGTSSVVRHLSVAAHATLHKK
jgi:hypothetical protein